MPLANSHHLQVSACGGNRGLIERAVALHARGHDLVLAIVTATAGSTYQKPGALALLDMHGLRVGAISGGCLEPELELKARDALNQQRAQLAEFNTLGDEDLVFGSGIGCRGQMWVLLLPQSARGEVPLLQALASAQQRGAALTLQIDCSTDIGAGSARMTAQQQWSWDNTGASADVSHSATTLLIPPPATRLHIAAPIRLLLLGAGPETPSLIACTRQMGWFAWVAEHRSRWAQLAHQAQADRVIELAPLAAHAEWRETHFDAVLVMSHNFSTDLAHLRLLSSHDVGYVGLLGPPARRDELLIELAEDASRLQSRLHAPVGLPLGGQGPEAIALSIAAELQQHLARVAAAGEQARG